MKPPLPCRHLQAHIYKHTFYKQIVVMLNNLQTNKIETGTSVYSAAFRPVSTTVRVRRGIVLLLGALAFFPTGKSPARTLESGGLDLRVTPISFPNPLLAPATLIEFSYVISQSGLEFLTDSAGSQRLAGIYADVVLFDSTNTPVDSSSQVYYTRESNVGGERSVVSNRLRLAINPGSYSYRLTVMDITSKREESRSNTLNVVEASRDRLSISGVEFAHRLERVDEDNQRNNPLVKNGRLVTPNPLGVCSIDDSLIHIYAEIYNLARDTAGGYRMGVRVELVESGALFPSILDESFWEVEGGSIVFAKSIEHKTKKPGKYMFNLIVTDANAEITDTSARPIYFYDPETGSFFADGAAGADGFGPDPYDTTSLETRRNIVYWLLSPRDRGMMESLNDVGQQQFIKQFWIDNDDNKATRVNEYRNELIARFAIANRRYSRSIERADGWNTDPGRVIMQYGEPDERMEVAIPSIGNDVTDEHSWERWNYDRIQGGVYFIFANDRGYSEFRLRHSNAQGERFDSGVEENINRIFRSTGG